MLRGWLGAASGAGTAVQSLHVQPAAFADVTEPIGLAAALTSDAIEAGGQTTGILLVRAPPGKMFPERSAELVGSPA